MAEFEHSGVLEDDLINIAQYCVIEAAQKYEISKTRFFSYWYPIALHEVQEFLLKASYKGKSSGFAGISLDGTVNGDETSMMVSDVVGTDDTSIKTGSLYETFEKMIKTSKLLETKIQRKIVLLYLDGFEINEIVKKTGASRSSIYRALKVFKKIIEEHYQG